MKHLHNLFALFFAIAAIVIALHVNEVYTHSPVLGVLLGFASPFFAVMSYVARRLAITQSRPVLPEIKGARWISGRLYIDRDRARVICCNCVTTATIEHLEGAMHRCTCPSCGAIAYVGLRELMK